MKLFTKEITIHSKRSVSEITEILNSVTGKTLPFGKAFLGTVDNEHFRMQAVSYYKNSFAPWLNGKMVEKNNGTDIYIKAEPFNRSFLIAIFAMIALAMSYTFLRGIYTVINEGMTTYNLLQAAFPIPFMIILFAIANLAFSVPAKRALGFLEELLQ